MSKSMARIILTATLFLLSQSPVTAIALPVQPTAGPALWERLTAPLVDLWGKLFVPEPAEQPASLSEADCDNRGGLDPWGHH